MADFNPNTHYLVQIPGVAQPVAVPKAPTPEERDFLTQLLPTVADAPATKFEAEHPNLADAGKVWQKSVYGGMTAIPRLVDVAANWLNEKIPLDKGFFKEQGQQFARLDADILGKARPKTEWGKAAGNVGESVVAAAAGPKFGMSLWDTLKMGFGAGVGGELSARTFGDSPLSRALGAFGGGVAPQLKDLVAPSNANTLIKRTTSGMTPEDWRAAEKAGATLDEAGVGKLASQLLGRASALDDEVRNASAIPEIRPSILSAVRNVPSQARQALDVWMNKNLPVAPDSTRNMLQEVQDAAKNADTAALGRANAAFAQNMSEGLEPYNRNYLNEIRSTLMDLAKTKYGVTSEGGKAIMRFVREKFPGDDVPRTAPFRRPDRDKIIDQLKQYVPESEYYDLLDNVDDAGTEELLDLLGQYKGRMQPEHLNNLVKDLNAMKYDPTWSGLPIEDLRQTLKRYTPEFDSARQAKTTAMVEDVNPLRKGLAGDILRVGGGPQADRHTATVQLINTAFPVDRAQPEEILQLASHIGSEPVGWLTREYLTRAFEKVARKNALGAEEVTPADFWREVYGSEAQRKNLEAAFQAIAPDQGVDAEEIVKGFSDLLDGFKTYKDLKLSPGLDRVTSDFEAGKTGAEFMAAPMSRTGRWFHETTKKRSYADLAAIVTSPDGLAKIKQIAQTPDPNRKAMLVRAMLSQAVLPWQEKTAQQGAR